MAEGSRITQEGFYRVTESLDQRITQNFAPLYAISSLSSPGSQLTFLTAKYVLARDFASTTSFSADADLVAKGAANVASTASISFTPIMNFPVSKTLESSGSFSIRPWVIRAVATLVGSAGTVHAYGGFLASGESSLNSSGSMIGSGQMIFNAISNSQTDRRVTENGDPRIADSGEFRASINAGNTGISDLSATLSVTKFVPGLKANVNGVWGTVSARIKRSGTWVTPKVYVKDNGTWKRVY
jgi:hypothetical protein